MTTLLAFAALLSSTAAFSAAPQSTQAEAPAPESTQSAPPPAAAPSKPAKPAKPKLICHVDDQTGSIMGTKRVCKTAEQWQKDGGS